MSTQSGTLDQPRSALTDTNPLTVLYPLSLVATNFAAGYLSHLIGATWLGALLVVIGVLVVAGTLSQYDLRD